MPDPAAPAGSEAAREAAREAVTAQRFLTFRLNERRYALPAAEVSEVIRVPAVARAPHSPKALLGLANLRGAVLPVASLGGLLGQDGAQDGVGRPASRAIVLDGAAPVVLAVDAVEALVSVDADRVETRSAALAARPGERLRGAFRLGGSEDVVKILDIRGLLADVFVPRARPPRQQGAAGRSAAAIAEPVAGQRQLVSFDVAGQEYALDLAVVQEITPAPEALAVSPHSEAVLLGVTAYRDTLLPVLSLRGLLGFAPPAHSPTHSDRRETVLVTRVGGVLVGLVVDRVRSIVGADPDLVDPPPAMLAARMGGESRIEAIYRGEGGRRLISILAPEHLFREEIMRQLSSEGGASLESGSGGAADTDAPAQDHAQVLVFRLGDEEFGLPIEAIDEVAHVPERITRLPKTPDFLEGVVNLRGEVLPVIDQRRRFDMPKLEGGGLEDGARRRLVVVRTERHRAGLIVDSVSEVLRSPRDAIEPAPDLTGEATRLVNGVINLQRQNRMVLLLDPAELLSRAERGLLDAFGAASQADW